MAAVGFWSLLPLLQHPGVSSVSAISGTGDPSAGRPLSCEPQIRSARSLVYVEQGEAAGLRAADLKHLPDPKGDNRGEKWTERLRGSE